MSVNVVRSGPVTTVILDRPHARNAVDGPTALALYDAFEEFDRDESASVAVLWGEHGTFCAGADLKAIGTADSNPTHRPRAGSDVAGRPAPAPMGPSRMTLSKPVIAAVSGYAVAGGLELALWCDLRVVEEDAIFGVFCRRWGVPLIDGGTVRLPRLVGHSRAMDMILTGRPVGAQEALAMGLVNKVVPLAALEAEGVAWARQVLRHSPTAIRCLKAAFNAETDGMAGLQELAGQATHLFYRTAEGQEGRNAFLEKREPDFSDNPWLP